jgi:hypothetical protein
MDPEFLKTQIEDSLRENISTLIELLRDVNVNIPDDNVVLQRLLNLQGPLAPEQDLIEQFTFEIPELTYNQFIAILGAMKPERGSHILDKNGVLYFNNNNNSYVTITPEMAYASRRRQLYQEARDAGNEPNAEFIHAQSIRAQENQAAINNDKLIGIPEWRLLERELPNDVRQEDALLHFTDQHHRQVDWDTVVKKLKQFGESVGYSMAHYGHCLDRFIAFFQPHLKTITDPLPPVEKARFLLRTNIPENKYDRITRSLYELTRNTTDSLKSMVGHIQGLALALYQDRPQRDQELLVNRLIINGLLSFTTGSTNTSLTQTITSLQIRNQIPQWKQLLDACVKSERLNGAPTIPLQFKPPPKNVVNLYHSTNQPVEPDPLYEIVPVQPPLILEQENYQPPDRRYGYKKITPVHEPKPTVGPRRINQRHNQGAAQNNNNINNAQHHDDNNDTNNQVDNPVDQDINIETVQEQIETQDVNTRPQTRNRIQEALRITTTQDGTPIINLDANRPQSSATAYNNYDDRPVAASTRSSRTRETLQKIVNSPKNKKSYNNSTDEQDNYQVDLMLTQYDRRPSREDRSRYSKYRNRDRSSSRERSESRERYSYKKYPSKQMGQGVPRPTYRNDSSKRIRRSWSRSPSRYNKYRSYSRDRYNRSSSRNSYRRRYNRSQSRERYNKKNTERNNRSVSNNRNKSNYNNKNKQSNYSRSTSRSNMKDKFCRKCFIKNAHEEEECPIYNNKATEKCRKCNNGYHYTKECRAKTRSPSANRAKSPRKN